MGVITPDRFNPIKAYCNVRLQQGVPLVDADVNELDDIRKFEVRAFLKWFVGNGIPDGNDGFRIVAATPAAAADFVISAGPQATGTAPAAPSPAANEFVLQTFGRCIVDGLDVIIPGNLNYKAQALHNSQAGAAALSTAYGVPVVADPPTTAGLFLAYLDIWEHPVNSTDPVPVGDPQLVVPPLGTESCTRTRRDWVVRTRTITAASTIPVPGNTDYIANHLYYGLATINRRVVGGTAQPIVTADITDQREQALLTPPSTLVYDVLGSQNGPSASATALAYRQAQNRPVMPLRDAINALLRGDLPGTAEQMIPSLAGVHNDFISYGTAFDQAGGAITVWSAGTGPTPSQVLGARSDPLAVGGAFTGPTQITALATPRTLPHAVVLPNGDILVAYNSTGGAVGSEDVFFLHGTTLATLAAATETAVANTASVSERHPFAVIAPQGGGGGYVVFFWHTTSPSPQWSFRRRLYDGTWTEAGAVPATPASWVVADGAGISISATAAEAAPLLTVGDFHAAAGADGFVWTAYTTGAAPSTIQPVRLTPSSGALTPALTALNPVASTSNTAPFVLFDGTGLVWIFFASNTGIYCQQYTSSTAAAVGTPTLVPGTSAGASGPTAVLDRRGGIWLFWSSGGANGRILSARFNPTNHAWGAVRQVTGSTANDITPFATLGPTGSLWLFWRRVDASANGTLWSRQIISEI